MGEQQAQCPALAGAVIFASLVDDPSAHPEQFPTEDAQKAECERLFAIIREVVKWENSNNSTVLDAAHADIVRTSGGRCPHSALRCKGRLYVEPSECLP